MMRLTVIGPLKVSVRQLRQVIRTRRHLHSMKIRGGPHLLEVPEGENYPHNIYHLYFLPAESRHQDNLSD